MLLVWSVRRKRHMASTCKDSNSVEFSKSKPKQKFSSSLSKEYKKKEVKKLAEMSNNDVDFFTE